MKLIILITLILVCICLSILFLYLFLKLILWLISKIFGKITFKGFDAAGFMYDDKQDIFYSKINPWQKKYGYGHTYDVFAPLIRLIMDTEPVRFRYNNKNWLMTFWKGQYGITTGGEIGIYNTTAKRIHKNTIYGPVKDNEMLQMSFWLLKKNKVLFYRSNYHWWLTGFKLGMFSKPKQLKMLVEIKFKDKEMLRSFLKSFRKLGYRSSDYEIIGNNFTFLYEKPHSKQPFTRNWLITHIQQGGNKRMVKLYNNLTSDIVEKNNRKKNKRQSRTHLWKVSNKLEGIKKY